MNYLLSFHCLLYQRFASYADKLGKKMAREREYFEMNENVAECRMKI